MTEHKELQPLRFRWLTSATCGAIAFIMAVEALALEKVVLARVDGVDITAQDVASASKLYAEQLSSVPADARRSILVEGLIELQLISGAAVRAGIEKTEKFESRMKVLKAQTLNSLFMDQKLSERVSDEVVKKTYIDQISRIPPVEEFRFLHILLKTEATAKEVIRALDAGEDFSALAERYSKDEVSKSGGGDLGFNAAGQNLAEFDKIAVSLEIGEYTKTPIVSAFGFHLLKLEEKRNRPPPPFEVVSGQIRASLEGAARHAILTELRGRAKIEKLIADTALPDQSDEHEHNPD